MTQLLVVTGPPGAGKSTVAEELAAGLPRSALVRGDDFFGYVRGGRIDPWLPDAHEQNEVVLQAAAAAAGRFALGGVAVVYDGVVGPWFLPTFAAATGLAALSSAALSYAALSYAALSYAALSYVVLLPPEPVCLARVAGRTGHGFTDADAARRMHRQFTAAEVAPRHLLADPPGPPSAVAAVIRQRWEQGTLRWEP